MKYPLFKRISTISPCKLRTFYLANNVKTPKHIWIIQNPWKENSFENDFPLWLFLQTSITCIPEKIFSIFCQWHKFPIIAITTIIFNYTGGTTTILTGLTFPTLLSFALITLVITAFSLYKSIYILYQFPIIYFILQLIFFLIIHCKMFLHFLHCLLISCLSVQ